MAKNDKKTPETTKQPVADEQTPHPAATEEAEKAAAEPDAATDAAAEAECTEGLVKMHKDGTHLHVHPTTVEAHKAAGWKHA